MHNFTNQTEASVLALRPILVVARMSHKILCDIKYFGKYFTLLANCTLFGTISKITYPHKITPIFMLY